MGEVVTYPNFSIGNKNFQKKKDEMVLGTSVRRREET